MTALDHLWRDTATAAEIHLALAQAWVWLPDTDGRTVSSGVIPADRGGDSLGRGHLDVADHPGSGRGSWVPGARPAGHAAEPGRGGEVVRGSESTPPAKPHLPATYGTKPGTGRDGLDTDDGKVRESTDEAGAAHLPASGPVRLLLPVGGLTAQPGRRRPSARTARRGLALNLPAPAALPLIPALRRALADVVRAAAVETVEMEAKPT